jgi:hypothetical protein
MGVSIRIDEGIYNEARKIAAAECRSIPAQIEFWARVGKAALANPDLPIDFILELLISKNSDRSLAEAFTFEGGDDGNHGIMH